MTGKDLHQLKTLHTNVVHLHFKVELHRGEAQGLGVDETIKGQHYADPAARPRQGLRQLAHHIFNSPGSGQGIIFPGDHPDIRYGLIAELMVFHGITRAMALLRCNRAPGLLNLA